jgi:hypothetical protein
MTAAKQSVVVYEREGRRGREREGTITKIGKQRARKWQKVVTYWGTAGCFVLTWQQPGREMAGFAVASVSSWGYRTLEPNREPGP